MLALLWAQFETMTDSYQFPVRCQVRRVDQWTSHRCFHHLRVPHRVQISLLIRR